MLSLRGAVTASRYTRSILSAFAVRAASTIESAKLEVHSAYKLKPIPPMDSLVFGHEFSDHMLEIDWNKKDGYHAPVIRPFENFGIHPAASVLHYGLECFEGMKAYVDAQGKIRMFRPEKNMARMGISMKRLGLPELNEKEFLECIKKLVKVEKRWIPNKRGFSLYIRPTAISTQPTLGVGMAESVKLFCILSPVGPYYKTGFAPVSLLASDFYTRAWPGGTGNCKVGGNYALTIMPQIEANKKGYNQVLWLFGKEDYCTEVGTMNFFTLWKNEKGEKELVTAPLDGTILPGVTRDSILDMCRNWGQFKVSERKFTLPEVLKAKEDGRLIECFGAGTAAIVSPVKNICYKGKDYAIPIVKELNSGELTKKVADEIMAIQYGEKTYKDWSVIVD